MYHDRQGSDVWLVDDGRVVTRFSMDIPPGILVCEISSGKRSFKRFGRGEKLTAVQHGRRVLVCVASQSGLLATLAERPDRQVPVREGRKMDRLTDRQSQVLAGMATGQTLAEIGFKLGIRERSVRHHVDALKQHFGAVSLSELVAKAVASGALECTPPQGGTGAGRQSNHPKIF
ncbi:MAG: LuxR C-terminal-related transcriptional regulator [Anaerolineaceae bacterium]